MSDTPAQPQLLTELKLPDDLSARLDAALTSGKPVAVAYVDAEGKPHLSYRGTTQVHGDNQLAMWSRNPEGGLPAALPANPHLALLYADWTPDARSVLMMSGRGRIETSEAERSKIYDTSPELERNQDPDRKGVAIVVDIDSIDGLHDGKFLRMRR